MDVGDCLKGYEFSPSSDILEQLQGAGSRFRHARSLLLKGMVNGRVLLEFKMNYTVGRDSRSVVVYSSKSSTCAALWYPVRLLCIHYVSRTYIV